MQPTREITTAASWELYQHLVLSLYQLKKIMEQVKNEIKKAVIKKDRLNVVYNERFSILISHHTWMLSQVNL